MRPRDLEWSDVAPWPSIEEEPPHDAWRPGRPGLEVAWPVSGSTTPALARRDAPLVEPGHAAVPSGLLQDRPCLHTVVVAVAEPTA
jgi:hypothetical protein